MNSICDPSASKPKRSCADLSTDRMSEDRMSSDTGRYARSWPRALGRAALNFFYPNHCIACEYSLEPDEEHLCTACWKRLPIISSVRCQRCSYCAPFAEQGSEPRPEIPGTGTGGTPCPNCHSWSTDPERVLAWARFDDITPDLVHAIKFAGKRRLARLIGYRMGNELRDDLNQVDALVPVPLHPTRRRERGYNQSLCIAEGLAEVLDKPLMPHLVKRSRATQQQAKLDGESRLDNVRGAFEARDRVPSDSLIGVVDDVSTTGATIADCGRALKAAGARSVWGIVAASTFRRH